ncbi:MAG: GntR family transcriptional regulator [Opitutaceae bacterium]|nr:GntR family transcriptional regulator [Verrucomicrobiales bacterium]
MKIPTPAARPHASRWIACGENFRLDFKIDCPIVVGHAARFMFIQLNFKSGLPVYLQMVEQIKTAAASGGLKSGDALPGIRPLAEELRVNRNTVAKAYSELENQGIIETVAGKGCFVKDGMSLLKKDTRRKMLAKEIDDAIVQAHHLQIPRDEFLHLAGERFDYFEQKQRSSNS